MDTNTSSTLDKRAAITAKQNLQIVRQRHQGRTFVNSTSSNADAQEWTGFSKPISERMKFVAQKNPEGRKKRRERSRAASNSTSTSEGKDSPEKRNSSNGTVPEKAHDQMVTDHMERHPGSDCSSISTDQALDLSDLWSVSEAGFLEDFASQAGTYPGLEAWSPEELPTLWSDNNKGFVTYYTKYLYLPLSLPFETLYSITDCSQQISESSDFLLSDPLALDCTLSICALFNLLENGKQDSAESPFHCSKLCALANQILSSDETGSPARQMLIIQPVSSLAIIAGLVGNYNDWYLHMQGLKSLVNSLGGQERLSPRMRTLIRQADLAGAFRLATEPIFPLIRFTESVSCTIPAHERQRTREAITRNLLGAGVTASVIENFVDLAHFIQVVDRALSSDGQIQFNIDTLAEDWFRIQHNFLVSPKPIRGRQTVPSSPANGQITFGGEDLGLDDWSPTPDSDLAETLTTALRLTSLLCMALTGPRIAQCDGRDASGLLSLLLKTLWVILHNLRAQTASQNAGSRPSTAEFSVARASQALIWICLGAEYAWTVSQMEEWCWEKLRSEYAVVGHLLAEVVGKFPHDVALFSKDEPHLSQAFDFLKLRRRSP